MISFTSIYLSKAPSPHTSTYMLGFQHMNMTGIQFSSQQTARESLSSKKEHFEQLLGRCEGERMRVRQRGWQGRRPSCGKELVSRRIFTGEGPAVGKSWFREGYLQAQGLQGGGMRVYCILGAEFQHGG